MESEKTFDLVELRKQFQAMGTGQFDLIRDKKSGIAVVTINHPDKRNSVTGSMMAQMDDVLSELENWTEVSGLLSLNSKG